MDIYRPIAAATLVAQLTERMRCLEHACRGGGATIGSGCAALDQLLPAGGLRRGSLVEWLAEGPGSGAGTLALAAAREACRAGKALVVLDRRRTFYAPAAVAMGFEPARIIVVRPERRQDELWALDQALRTPGVGAALAWPERWSDHAFRRLQLAAESGGTLGLLVRGLAARHDPSWADVRLVVTSLSQNQNRRGEGDSPILLSGLRKIGTVPGGCLGEGDSPILLRRPAASAAGARRKIGTVPGSCVQPAAASGGRRVRVELARCRSGTAGRALEVEIDEGAGWTIAASQRHETHGLPVAAPLAVAAVGCRSRGA